MKELIFEAKTFSEEETESAAELFSEKLKDGDILCFFAGVGAGKTVFARGICKGLGITETVNSPSYIIMNLYKSSSCTVYHYDLYRINSADELTETGLYEMAGDPGTVTLIEWSEILDERLPVPRIELKIDVLDEATRKITAYRMTD